MANLTDEREMWIEVEVCLMNEDDYNQKLRGIIRADQVNMLNMKIKVDTGCSELALPTSLVKQLKLDYYDTVSVSSSTDNNVSINRYGPLIIYWDGQIYKALTYSMPSLDSPLLGLKPLLSMKPDFDWKNNTIKRSLGSFPSKKYYIKFDEIYKVIGSDDKIQYFAEQGVKLHVSNEGGSTMFLIIAANRFNINIDAVAETISHMAPSLKPVSY